MTYLLLLYEFFKTGLFAVGGGLATLPFLYSIADRYPWFDTEMLTRMIAVSESTPGPIGVNMATYTGFTAGGVLGAVVSTLSLVAPSVIVIIIVAKMLARFRQNKLVDAAFYGLRPAVSGMIAAAAIAVIEVAMFVPGAADFVTSIRWEAVALFAALLFGLLKFKKHPIIYIAIAAVVGIVFKF